MIRLVNSRRLGLSLGIDLVEHKICSLDCIYCEAGATTDLTTEVKAYKDISVVYNELSDYLNTKSQSEICDIDGNTSPKIDYITFSGLGEPTLSSDLAHILKLIKKNWNTYKTCLITNSTMLYSETLQKDLALCDLVIPSLDAVSEEVFQTINRPHKDIKAKQIVESLVSFRKSFKNQMWLEIFFIAGINDTVEELTLLKQACQRIKPDKIQLNSLDRNGLFDWVKKVPEKRLKEILEHFKPLPAEII